MDTTTETSGHALVVTRLFDAPRSLVWEAWTQAEHISQWWGPKGFSTRVETLEFRPGGTWRYIMTAPDGKEYPVIGEFLEIVEPEKIVGVDHFGEEYQAVIDPSKLPSQVIMTTIFEEEGNQTRITITMTHPSAEDKAKNEQMGAVHGWNAGFDQLADYLATVK